jgi:hypothetical protein
MNAYDEEKDDLFESDEQYGLDDEETEEMNEEDED